MLVFHNVKRGILSSKVKLERFPWDSLGMLSSRRESGIKSKRRGDREGKKIRTWV